MGLGRLNQVNQQVNLGQLSALMVLLFLFAMTQRSRPSLPQASSPPVESSPLWRLYGPKIEGWKRKSLLGYSRALDKKWKNWLEEMAK